MDITWYGHSCFRLNERGLGSLVCDPYDHETIGYDPLKLKADIVTISNEKPGHSCMKGIKTDPFVISRPGEYEVNNIFVKGHATNKKGEPRNTIFVIEYNGIFVAHLGNLNRLLTKDDLEALGTINILLVPVGGGAALTSAQAVETVRMIQPAFVIPMHYAVPRTIPQLDPVDKFLKEMGVQKSEEKLTVFKVPPRAQMQEDQTRVIVLEHPLGSEDPQAAENEGAAEDAA